MDNMNSIGLHEGSASQLAEKLNHLLANYQIFYMNVRGYHWNVKGNDFFELHAKFEEFYTDLLTKVDEVAERILTLGHKPVRWQDLRARRSGRLSNADRTAARTVGASVRRR